MATPLQGYIGTLQGDSYSLQGSIPNLQGSTTNLQGTTTAAPTPTAVKQPVVYGNTSATSPKQQYINSLGAYKYADDPTVYGNYNGSSDYAFHSADEFLNAGGNFANVEVRQRPPTTSSGSSQTSSLPDSASSLSKPSALDTARAAYLNSLNPSPDVTSAQKKYLDFITNEKLGETALEGQGRGIPLALVRGQQAKLNQQSEAEASRLQGDVGIAQDSATALQNKAKAALDFATTDAAGNKPLELAAGSTLVRLNPATGKYETVANGPAKPESLPTSAQEFQYFQSLSPEQQKAYTDYQNADANRKRTITNLNVAGGSNTVDSIAQALLSGNIAPSQLPGFGANSLRSLALARAFELNPNFDASTAEQQFAYGKSTKTQGQIAMGQAALQTIDRAVTNSDKVDRGQLTFLNGLIIGTQQAMSDENTATFITDINSLGDEIGTVLGQGSATDFKTQLGLVIANPNLSKSAFKASMDELASLFKNRINEILTQAGKDTLSSSGSTTSGSDPLGIR